MVKFYNNSTISLHFEKHKGGYDGLQRHDEREPGQKHSNKNIKDDRTKDNINLHRAEGKTWSKRINGIIAREYRGSKSIIKDAVKLVTATVQLGGSLGSTDVESDQVQALMSAYEELRAMYGEEHIVSASIHVDEITPHLNVAFVPMIDGVLSAKRVLGGKMELKKTQEKFLKAMQEREPRMRFGRKTDQTLNGLEQSVFERLTRLSEEHERELDERENELDEREEQLENRERDLTRREQKLTEGSKLNQKRAFELDEREKSIKLLEKDLSSREGSILAREGEVSKREQTQKTREDELKQKHESLQESFNSKVGEANARLKERRDKLAQAEREALAERERLEADRKEADEREKELEAREQVLRDKAQALKSRETSLESARDRHHREIKRDMSEVAKMIAKVRQGEELQRQERERLQEHEDWYHIEEDYEDDLAL